jgi:hypothetical protein
MKHNWIEKRLLSGKALTVCRECGVLQRMENKEWFCKSTLEQR